MRLLTIIFSGDRSLLGKIPAGRCGQTASDWRYLHHASYAPRMASDFVGSHAALACPDRHDPAGAPVLEPSSPLVMDEVTEGIFRRASQSACGMDMQVSCIRRHGSIA
jgi:hypothetical protein